MIRAVYGLFYFIISQSDSEKTSSTEETTTNVMDWTTNTASIVDVAVTNKAEIAQNEKRTQMKMAKKIGIILGCIGTAILISAITLGAFVYQRRRRPGAQNGREFVCTLFRLLFFLILRLYIIFI